MSEIVVVGGNVTFHRFIPSTRTKKASSIPTPAIVTRISGAVPGDGPNLDLVFLDPSKLSLLNSGDWANAFERAIEVPHEDNEAESHHSWGLASESEPSSDLVSLKEAQAEIEKLKGMLSKSGELEAGVDKVRGFILSRFPSALDSGVPLSDYLIDLLHSFWDATSAVPPSSPSGADLDSVAADEAAKEATSGKTNGKKPKPVAVGK